MQNKQEIFNKALQLHMKGKFDEAQKIYLKLINKNINNDKLFFFYWNYFPTNQ